MSVLEPRVTSNARLRFSIFSNPSYFCMWNFDSMDEGQLALFPHTKLRIQKCNTCRYIEKRSRVVCYITMVQCIYVEVHVRSCHGVHYYRSTAVEYYSRVVLVAEYGFYTYRKEVDIRLRKASKFFTHEYHGMYQGLPMVYTACVPGSRHRSYPIYGPYNLSYNFKNRPGGSTNLQGSPPA